MYQEENTVVSQTVFQYKMAPGDATCYEFDFEFMDHDYVGITVKMSSSQGHYRFMKEALQDPAALYDYAHSKMPGVDPYTLMAVLLAANVFANVGVYEIDMAKKEMLRVSEMFNKYKRPEVKEEE